MFVIVSEPFEGPREAALQGKSSRELTGGETVVETPGRRTPGPGAVRPRPGPGGLEPEPCDVEWVQEDGRKEGEEGVKQSRRRGGRHCRFRTL